MARKFSLMAALAMLCGLSFTVQAAPIILLDDTFDTENGGAGQLNYTSFTNWNVTDGSVDLIGNDFYDFYPGNGLYLDLDGSTWSAGTLESKNLFALTPGDYELRFDLGGAARTPGWWGASDTVSISLGSLFNESFTLNYTDPLSTVIRNFSVTTSASERLIFEHAGGDMAGLILDNVRLSQVAPSPVPDPGTLFLLGSGLAGLALTRKRPRRGRELKGGGVAG